MNVFGRLAEFIWDYQEEIQIAFIIIVIAAAIYVVARMVRASRKKRELLSQISDTVTQISTAVSSISDKQSGVVYIDNRVGADARPRAIEVIENTVRPDPCGPSREGNTPEAADPAIKGCPSEDTDCAEAAAVDTASSEIQDRAEPVTENPEEAKEKEEGTGEEKSEENTVQAVRKYFSRDCAVSKKGKYYTLEELNDQIRE